MIIGLPTLRLRGDYIAIVTLAFGEIIGRFASQRRRDHDLRRLQADERPPGDHAGRQDRPAVPRTRSTRALNLRPYYWTVLALVLVVLFVNFRLRDSRLGRAWIALREDEVAAASMGVPLVKTKLLAYATGARVRRHRPARSSARTSTRVNAEPVPVRFSIFVLAMVILGGLGSSGAWCSARSRCRSSTTA